MRFFATLGLCLMVLGLFTPTGSFAQHAEPRSQSEVCVPYAGGDLIVRRGSQAIPVTIDDFLAPGDPSEALCCGSCEGTACTGCVNLPTSSTCIGFILACPEGEILTDDGGGGCA
jgi:hypothetical protein